MKNMTTLSRRTFGGLVGASALSATVAFPAGAASPADDAILQLRSVPLAWPQYHRLDTAIPAPREGDRVTLVREGPEEVEAAAIAVFAADGARLGAIPRRHNAALFWALQRGDDVEARVVKVATPVVRGHPVPGWGAFHVDITVRRAVFV